MCVVSMIGDHYSDKWAPPHKYPTPMVPFEPIAPDKRRWRPDVAKAIAGDEPVSRDEFNALKREVEEMKELLKRAVDYDKRTDQPDCETEEKMIIIRKVAEAVGVDLDEVFKK